MTRAEIRAAIRDNLNEPTPGFWTDAELNRHIYSAYAKVAQIWKAIDPTAMGKIVDFSTTAGVFSHLLPTDFDRLNAVYFVRATDSIWPLAPIDFPDVRKGNYLDLMNQITGEPTRYLLRAGQIELRPIPNGVFTIRLDYQAIPVVLTDTNSPLIPTPFHDLLVLWGTIIAKAKEGDTADTYVQLYQSRITEFAEQVGPSRDALSLTSVGAFGE